MYAIRSYYVYVNMGALRKSGRGILPLMLKHEAGHLLGLCSSAIDGLASPSERVTSAMPT